MDFEQICQHQPQGIVIQVKGAMIPIGRKIVEIDHVHRHRLVQLMIAVAVLQLPLEQFRPLNLPALKGGDSGGTTMAASRVERPSE